MIRMFLFYGLFFLLIGELFSQNQQTIKGVVQEIANPCLTDPCLPGVKFAIVTDSVDYFISINGHLQDELLIVNNDTIVEGDSVKVVGEISIKQDIHGIPYYVLEFESLIPLSLSDNFDTNSSLLVYQNPTIDKLFIENFDCDKVISISLFDVNGKMIITQKNLCENFIEIQDIRCNGIFFVCIRFADNQIMIKKILLK